MVFWLCLWKREADVDILSYSKHHIEANVGMNQGKQWRLSGFYEKQFLIVRSSLFVGKVMKQFMRDLTELWFRKVSLIFFLQLLRYTLSRMHHHLPILLNCFPVPTLEPNKKDFKFENVWLQ